MEITFHYPPELLSLLIDTIPLLCRSKRDVFQFFQGAGIQNGYFIMPFQQWKKDASSITKYEIARIVLTNLNKTGEKSLQERREVLKRVIEFESFTSCWPADLMKAKGFVAEICKVVNVKDSFTRINIERESENRKRRELLEAEKETKRLRHDNIDKVHKSILSLFNNTDPQKRGKALEDSINSLFKAYDILIKEAFTLTGDNGEGIIEQVDGVIELYNHIYFVEMKWWNKPIGRAEISEHLVRVYHRAESRAIIISASEFTEPAIVTCKEALQHKVIFLCSLREIVMLLEQQADLVEMLKKKVDAATIYKKPLHECY